MGSEDICGRLMECRKIECDAAGPYVRCEHGGADAIAGKDSIFIGFAYGAVAGVELWRNYLC